jgi:hypothetical protein
MRRQIGRAVSAICSLPYPMLLGRKPIAIATMASITTTRMAAASISTSFSVAQSPRWRAPCAKYGPRCNARMRKLRDQGLALRAIADQMKASGVSISHTGVKNALSAPNRQQVPS